MTAKRGADAGLVRLPHFDNFRFQIPIPDSKLHNPDFRSRLCLHIANSRFQIPNSRSQIADSKLQIPKPDLKFHQNTRLATITNAFGILNFEFGMLNRNSNCESLGRFLRPDLRASDAGLRHCPARWSPLKLFRLFKFRPREKRPCVTPDSKICRFGTAPSI